MRMNMRKSEIDREGEREQGRYRERNGKMEKRRKKIRRQ